MPVAAAANLPPFVGTAAPLQGHPPAIFQPSACNMSRRTGFCAACACVCVYTEACNNISDSSVAKKFLISYRRAFSNKTCWSAQNLSVAAVKKPKQTNWLTDPGRKISSTSGDEREGVFLFQRVLVLVQRYDAVFLHDTLPATDCTD